MIVSKERKEPMEKMKKIVVKKAQEKCDQLVLSIVYPINGFQQKRRIDLEET